jgi:hypothetical protein
MTDDVREEQLDFSVVAKSEEKERIVFLSECCGNYFSNIHDTHSTNAKRK